MRIVAIVALSACRFSGATQLAPDAASRDAPPGMPDAFGTGTDAPATSARCYGPSMHAFEVCLGGIPAGVVTLPAMLDTSPAPGSPCLEAQPLGWAANQPAACFVVGGEILVPEHTIVIGTRPLVLVADVRIQITGMLDAASHVGGTRGPGATMGPACLPFARDVTSKPKGGGGGAGGSFMTSGGDGGNGDGMNTGGLSAGPDPSRPVALRAGCEGQTGGSSDAGTAGPAGAGGGVVYLAAGSEIVITGAVNASGAGGEGGGKKSGGSGGGSGGMIVLHAPILDVPGTLVANGGGGASGGTKELVGGSGEDPDPDKPTQAAAGGAAGMGMKAAASGGAGHALKDPALQGENGGRDKGGGGGGGGGGHIVVNAVIGGSVSPAAVVGL